MLYSLKKGTWENKGKSTSEKKQQQKTKTKTKTKTTRQYLSPVCPPTPCYTWTTPYLSHPSIICNNLMGIEFLVQMKQSDKCGSVRNDIFNLHLGSGAGPWASIPCLLQDTSHIYWFHPPKQLTRKKQKIQKRDSTLNKSYRTALAYVHRTQG